MAGSQKSALRASACESMRITLEAVVCDACEGLCWHVEVWGVNVAGTGENTCLLYRAHLEERSIAVLTASGWLRGVGGQLRDQEDRAWFLEHQQSLF